MLSPRMILWRMLLRVCVAISYPQEWLRFPAKSFVEVGELVYLLPHKSSSQKYCESVATRWLQKFVNTQKICKNLGVVKFVRIVGTIFSGCGCQ